MVDKQQSKKPLRNRQQVTEQGCLPGGHLRWATRVVETFSGMLRMIFAPLATRRGGVAISNPC